MIVSSMHYDSVFKEREQRQQTLIAVDEIPVQ